MQYTLNWRMTFKINKNKYRLKFLTLLILLSIDETFIEVFTKSE